MQGIQNLKAVAIGSLAAVFFSSTYILNSFLAVSGGYWAWTAGLRTTFLVFILVALLAVQGKLIHLLQVMKRRLLVWLLWGSVAFGLSYIFLTFGATFGPGWLIAGVFQFTIVAGILLSPLVYKDSRARIPLKALLLSVLILLGIIAMQWSQKEGSFSQEQLLWCVVLALLAAFSWPLANRKLLLYLEEDGEHLNAMQRVAGTAFGSLPVQLLLMGYGYVEAGLPGLAQVQGVLIITLSSGVAGCILFFKALHLARHNSASLAAVEATQSLEVLVTVVGEVLLLGISWPNWLGNLGMVLIIGGLVLYSLPSKEKVVPALKLVSKR
jgi:drug/metabolite transporter (DMT)-like permease